MGTNTDSGSAASVAGFVLVVESLIACARHSSISATDIRGWVNERARAGPPAITLDETDRGESDPLLLRVKVQEDCTEAVEDQLAELMMDMRLLGLRPTVVPGQPPRQMYVHQQPPAPLGWHRGDSPGSRGQPLTDARRGGVRSRYSRLPGGLEVPAAG